VRAAAGRALAVAALVWLAACAQDGAPAGERPFQPSFDCDGGPLTDTARCALYNRR
jgi:hypothetical protein